MPLFEVETDCHIIITWATDEDAASTVVNEAYPSDRVIRLTKRPRDTWVISKTALGIAKPVDPTRRRSTECHRERREANRRVGWVLIGAVVSKTWPTPRAEMKSV